MILRLWYMIRIFGWRHYMQSGGLLRSGLTNPFDSWHNQLAFPYNVILILRLWHMIRIFGWRRHTQSGGLSRSGLTFPFDLWQSTCFSILDVWFVYVAGDSKKLCTHFECLGKKALSSNFTYGKGNANLACSRTKIYFSRACTKMHILKHDKLLLAKQDTSKTVKLLIQCAHVSIHFLNMFGKLRQ